MGEFAALREANPGLSLNGHDAHGLNQAFFEWQRRGGWDTRFAPSQEVKELLKFFTFAGDVFLQAIRVPQAQLAARSRQTQGWATMHYGGIGHLAHTHPDNLLSGVYYVQLPVDCGPIIFRDPRGPLPPFDQTFKIVPQVTDCLSGSIYAHMLPADSVPRLSNCHFPSVSVLRGRYSISLNFIPFLSLHP